MKSSLRKKVVWGVALTALLFLGMSAPYASAQAGQAEPVKASGDVQPPKLLKSVSPVYPEEARKKRLEGTVILEVKTDVKGKVTDVKVLRSIPALDQAAIDAVKQWVYEPKIIGGKPVPIVFTVTVRFVLDKKEKGPETKGVVKQGEVEPPKLIKQVDPVYPEDARKQGIEGTVILEVTIDVEGKVKDVKVLESIPALDQAAVDAVKQWVYEPKIIDGKPKQVVCTVTVRFKLK